MTENSLNVGAMGATNAASYASGAQKSEETTKGGAKPIPVGQKQDGNKGKTELLKEPKMPEIAGQKKYFPQSGESVITIAKDNHIYVSELLKANPGMDKDKIYEGKSINVPYRTDSAWKDYQAKLSAYENQQMELSDAKYEAEQKAKLEARIANAESKIEKAISLEHGKEYNFKVDKEGNIVITLKKNKTLGDISDDFRLPNGHLLEKNPNIKKTLTPGTILDLDNLTRVNDWDEAEARKGDTFLINPEVFKPSAGWFKDLFE